MESLYEVDRLKKFNYLRDVYKRRFKELFSVDPLIDSGDEASLRKLIEEYKETKEKLSLLILGYFELDDDYVKKSGFKLQLINSKINSIIVNSFKGNWDRPKYVVALSQSGRPVLSYNQNEMNGYNDPINGKPYYYKPMLFSEWVNVSVERKLQVSKEKLIEAGNDVGLWFTNWKEWEYAQIGRN